MRVVRRTSGRLPEGENDHLITYRLRSVRFTTKPKIEPTLSAMEYRRSDAACGRIPGTMSLPPVLPHCSWENGSPTANSVEMV